LQLTNLSTLSVAGLVKLCGDRCGLGPGGPAIGRLLTTAVPGLPFTAYAPADAAVTLAVLCANHHESAIIIATRRYLSRDIAKSNDVAN